VVFLEKVGDATLGVLGWRVDSATLNCLNSITSNIVPTFCLGYTKPKKNTQLSFQLTQGSFSVLLSSDVLQES
jgi:hypothetical protein